MTRALACLLLIAACGKGPAKREASDRDPSDAAATMDVAVTSDTTDVRDAATGGDAVGADATGGNATGGNASGGNASGRDAGAAACSRDTDCVFVQRGCCGCNEGGHNDVMTKAAAKNVRRLRCDQTACPQVITTTVDCVGRPACRSGKCIAVPKDGASTDLLPRGMGL